MKTAYYVTQFGKRISDDFESDEKAQEWLKECTQPEDRDQYEVMVENCEDFL